MDLDDLASFWRAYEGTCEFYLNTALDRLVSVGPAPRDALGELCCWKLAEDRHVSLGFFRGAIRCQGNHELQGIRSRVPVMFREVDPSSGLAEVMVLYTHRLPLSREEEYVWGELRGAVYELRD